MRWPPASLVPTYLVLQALAIGGWWLVLWIAPSARAPFVVAGWPTTTLLAFWLPDVVLLVAGSLATAFGIRRGHAAAQQALWLVAGGVAYATLWCLGANLVTGSGWLATLLMVACSACMTWAVAVRR